MANGTRGSGFSNVPTDLYFQFLKRINYTFDPYSPESVNKVEIYDDQQKAEDNDATGLLETIQSANITEVDVGKFKYTAAAIAGIGTYFDKIYVTPDPGVAERTFVNPFYIRLEDYAGQAPGDHEKCRVFLNLFDIVDNPQEGDRVVVRMNVKRAWYGKDFIESEEEIFRANDQGQVLGQDGQVGMLLIETETLTNDTFPSGEDVVYYTFNILDKYYFKKTIPKGTLQVNFKDLPDYS